MSSSWTFFYIFQSCRLSKRLFLFFFFFFSPSNHETHQECCRSWDPNKAGHSVPSVHNSSHTSHLHTSVNETHWGVCKSVWICWGKGFKCVYCESGCALFTPDRYLWIVFIQPTVFPSNSSCLQALFPSFTLLSQQPVGTVFHPFSVCTAKCFYPLASGYALPYPHSLTFLWSLLFRLFIHARNYARFDWTNGTSPVWRSVIVP